MIVVPKTKILKIIMSIHVYLISQMNFNHKEIVERKAFLANPKHQYCLSQYGEHDCVPITKRMAIIISIQIGLV